MTGLELPNARIYLAPQDNHTAPSPQETVSQFVISAKSDCGGHEPGSRNKLIILNIYWIPDLAPQSGARPE